MSFHSCLGQGDSLICNLWHVLSCWCDLRNYFFSTAYVSFVSNTLIFFSSNCRMLLLFFSFFQPDKTVPVHWGAACYVLVTVLTVIHMISSTVFCLLMILTNLHHFLLKYHNFKKQCVPLSPLGCAFERSSTLELSQPETTAGLAEGERQVCTQHFYSFAVELQAIITCFLIH